MPSRILHHVPEGLDLKSAAVTEPLSVAYNAVAVKSQVRPGDTVLVFGAGAIGLFAVQMALVSGAGWVIQAGLSGST